jgi:hypothetical protein
MSVRSLAVGLAAVGLLSACGGTQPDRVSASPPTVFYRVDGSDTTRTHAQAAEYCQQYGMSPRYQGTRASGGENVAQYSCVASAGAPYGTTAPHYGQTQPPPGVKCADWLHQSRPGGSNYKGPPVPGCPQQ